MPPVIISTAPGRELGRRVPAASASAPERKATATAAIAIFGNLAVAPEFSASILSVSPRTLCSVGSRVGHEPADYTPARSNSRSHFDLTSFASSNGSAS